MSEDLGPVKKWLGEKKANIAVAALNRRHFQAQYVPSREEALRVMMEMIPEGVTVGRGDSVTINEVKVIPELLKRNRNRIVDPFPVIDGGTQLDGQLRRSLAREALTSDVFLTGVNALTLDGKLVSADALGNRVAAMIFGPTKVIVVAGTNKIVKNVDEAIKRIHEIVAPMNARRHYLVHNIPQFGELACGKTGACVDCVAEWHMCCNTVIIDGVFVSVKGRINVVLVGEELGI